MADVDQGQTQGQQQPGGRATRGPGPEVGESGPNVPVPPYDDRSSRGEGAMAGNQKAWDASNAPEPGPGREISKEEREGFDSAEMEPKDTHGVGAQITEPGEAVGPGEDFETIGTKGASNRPVGTDKPGQDTGVDPKENIEPDMPTMKRGDQGG